METPDVRLIRIRNLTDIFSENRTNLQPCNEWFQFLPVRRIYSFIDVLFHFAQPLRHVCRAQREVFNCQSLVTSGEAKKKTVFGTFHCQAVICEFPKSILNKQFNNGRRIVRWQNVNEQTFKTQLNAISMHAQQKREENTATSYSSYLFRSSARFWRFTRRNWKPYRVSIWRSLSAAVTLLTVACWQVTAEL